MKVTIGISNRHIHITKEDLEILFNEDKLDIVKPINQPNQFASDKKVDVKTEKGIIKGLRILGPCRSYTQVELSKTDCYQLGINPPVRTSGALEGAEVVTIVGPCGEITRECAIIADRHIHVTPQEKIDMGFENIDTVSVLVKTEKGCIMNDVHFKVLEESYYEMHIDTDDANANLITNGQEAEIIINNN